MKQRADKVQAHGRTIDSKAEARYQDHLEAELAAGRILSYEPQVSFELVPGFTCCGRKIRAMTYTCDFLVRHASGLVEIVDVKGWAKRSGVGHKPLTEAFRLRWKLLRYRLRGLGIRFTIARDGKPPDSEEGAPGAPSTDLSAGRGAGVTAPAGCPLPARPADDVPARMDAAAFRAAVRAGRIKTK